MATPQPLTIMTNIPQVMRELLNNIIKPGIEDLKGYIYDDEQDYESTITNARKASKNKDEVDLIPLFSYRRSPLRPHEAFSMRSISTTRDIGIVGDDANHYKSILGAFDVEFMVIADRMQEIENFEINYWCQNGFSETKEFSVDFEEVGTFLYQLEWGELESINTSATGDDRAKIVRGSFQVYGTFFSFKQVQPKITSISEQLWDWTGSEIFESEIIT